jgi:uncharacterized protein YndB with AHSA1/START domain
MSRTDVASRVIPATPETVFAALVDPDALTAWLPPDGMSGTFERFDARAGGSYRLIVPPVEGGTRIEIRADDVPAGISAEDHTVGLASSLRNLATYVGG